MRKEIFWLNIHPAIVIVIAYGSFLTSWLVFHMFGIGLLMWAIVMVCGYLHMRSCFR